MKNSTTAPKALRVAVYTRQSVASDLQFGSIEAQREAVENYIKSRAGEGWVALKAHYDDGGFSGSNTDRPALQRLLADAAAHKIDAIAVYRLDRISRSMADLTRLVLDLERLGVAFISTTESFDTHSAVGRLLLNILGSFAQFERESIASRTRDKIRATRQRGLWTGGRPILGYDIEHKQLRVNATEAATVRDVFATYLRCGGLTTACADLHGRGVRNKRWVNQGGKDVGGAALDKNTLRRLLTNPLYRGQVRSGTELVHGQHEAIVDDATFAAVQKKLAAQQNADARPARNRTGSLLSGILLCGQCGSAMVHSRTTKGARVFRYYQCRRIAQMGGASCPGSRAPAPELERVVVQQVANLGRDPRLQEATAAALRQERQARRDELHATAIRLAHERAHRVQEQGRLVDAVARGGDEPTLRERLCALDTELADLDRRHAAAVDELEQAPDDIDEVDLRRALEKFGPLWDALPAPEKNRLLALLLEKVEFDARQGTVRVTFRDHGLRTVARQARTERIA